ncbi:hypothetical protein PCE1_000021 [Barthelona sp. PCE]
MVHSSVWECRRVFDDQTILSRIIGVVLTLGIVIAVLPQLLRLRKTKSSAGLSCFSFAIASFNQFCVMFDLLILKLPVIVNVSKYSFWQFYDATATFWQALIMFLIYLPISYMYIAYHPRKDTEESHADFKRSKMMVTALTVFMSLSILWVLFYAGIFGKGACTSVIEWVADTYGEMSILNLIQWVTQTVLVFKLKEGKSLSIFLFALTGPGAGIQLYWLAVMNREPFSVWVSFLSSFVFQMIIFFQLLFYDVIMKGSLATTREDSEKPLLVVSDNQQI